jgi:hypothetical protein
MLAEVTAEDSQLPPDVPASTDITANIASSSSSSSSDESRALSPELQVSEDTIATACKWRSITQLRRWGRQGIRVQSADTVIDSMFGGMSLDIILRCTVKELGADISGARLEDGVTPLHVAFQVGN